ncbi:UDP-glycosyltransferase 85C1-like [Rutidosis leptorrhynchoides]|uniref:UDP-glycosyltransferase 85C1-like n=1 Tax=Rutidosis leptorrhynchoides TaxID=125765 RepID=UPI003A992612
MPNTGWRETGNAREKGQSKENLKIKTTMVNQEKKQPHAVFIPYPLQSHIKCMLKLARVLHHKGIRITFVNTQSNHKRLLNSSGSHDLNDVPDFQFKTIPDGLDNAEQTQTTSEITSYLAKNLFGSLVDLVGGLESPATCIVADGILSFAKTLLAAEKLKVPIILNWIFAACGFMGFYQAKVLMEKGIVPLKDESYLTNGHLDTLVDIPGMKGIRLRDLPEHVLGVKPTTIESLNFLVQMANDADKVQHMIIHTFDELESSLINELRSKFPRIYTVGPLELLVNQIVDQKENKNFISYSLRKEEPTCFKWLESKEPNSVVYVNFGSLAVMSLETLVEFGWGLVNSNHYFLWVIRSDLVDGGSGSIVLPLELVEAIKGKGFISNWCSQEEVLNHSSVGGFLTHGGWGSVIESLSAGVPMLCWPVSSDQKTNCRQMCTEWEVAMEIERNVKRNEVEKLLKELMEGAKGEKLRNKANEWMKKARIAIATNGSSFLNIEKLVNEIHVFSK